MFNQPFDESRLDRIWRNIHHRCEDPNASGYKNYGGKGIKLCQEWKNFFVFKKWALENGYDDTLTIERVDPNKDYCPENCCWIPKSEQQKTSSNSKQIEVDGVTLNLADWCKKLGIHRKTMQHAINKRGKDPIEYIRSKLKKQNLNI